MKILFRLFNIFVTLDVVVVVVVIVVVIFVVVTVHLTIKRVIYLQTI